MGSLIRPAVRNANAMLERLAGLRLVRAETVSRAERRDPRAPEIVYTRLAPYAAYAPWLSDRDFQDVYGRIESHTLVDVYRCYELWSLARQVRSVPGDLLEVGVWRGGTGALLAKAVADTGKKVYLADTYSGVVKAGDMDTRYVGGEHADTSEELVRSLLSSMGLTNAETLRGMFPEDTASRVPGPISLLHVDVDVYSSGKDTVEWALPRLGSGSAIVFDDYGFEGCQGITRLVEEFRSTLTGFRFVYNLNGHAVFVKL